jgi:hypothetical protein
VVEEAREVGVDARRTADAAGRQIVQVVPKMNVRQDKQALVRGRDHDTTYSGITTGRPQGEPQRCVLRTST